VPAAIWLFHGRQVGMGIFMSLWGLFGISGIDNIVRPFLISRGSELPFALVFLGAVGGLLVFGFIGMFLGPALLAVGFCLLKEFVRGKPGSDAAGATPKS
jgi:predicted PurR-regulated permease PerM